MMEVSKKARHLFTQLFNFSYFPKNNFALKFSSLLAISSRKTYYKGYTYVKVR